MADTTRPLTLYDNGREVISEAEATRRLVRYLKLLASVDLGEEDADEEGHPKGPRRRKE